MRERLPEGGREGGASANYVASRDRVLLSCGLAAGLLFWAALANGQSHGFYTFLRIYICGLSLFLAYAFHIVNRPAWALAALCTSILFNPILHVDLKRDDWKIVDFVLAAIFAWLALQPYARMTGRRWVPIAPGIAALLLVVATNEPKTSYADDNTMNVDNLALENLVVNDTTQVSAGSQPEMDMSFDANMTVSSRATGVEIAANLEEAAEAVENAANAVAASGRPESWWSQSTPVEADSQAEEESTGTFDDLVPAEREEEEDGSEEQAN